MSPRDFTLPQNFQMQRYPILSLNENTRKSASYDAFIDSLVSETPRLASYER